MLATSRFLALLSMVAVVACSDDPPPAPTDVRTAIRDDLGRILRETKAAYDGSTANLPTGAAFDFVPPIFIDGQEEEREGEVHDVFDPDAITQRLETELFDDAFHLGNGIYRVQESLLCEVETHDPETGMTSTTLDEQCSKNFERAELRVRVANEDGGIRFYIQADANHDEPLSFLLERDRLSMSLNLDEAGAALAAIGPMVGISAEKHALSGAITGTLQILGAAHAKGRLAFERPLSIQFGTSDSTLGSPDASQLLSAAAPVVAIELDAGVPKATLDLALGASSLHAPGDSLSSGNDLALGGATVNAVFENGTLKLTNVSLGQMPATQSINGQTALSFDLNPDAGRKFDATITADAVAGAETVTVSPRFDVRTYADHALFGEDGPVYDVTRIQIEGSLRASEATGRFEVLAGTFSLTTDPAQYGFTASTGQCVQETENYDNATFTTYTTYSVGACQ
jgi:hypothetical protein